MFMKHVCPQQQQSQMVAKSVSPTFLPHPTLRGMTLKCEQPLDELTVQVWSLYHHQNFKYEGSGHTIWYTYQHPWYQWPWAVMRLVADGGHRGGGGCCCIIYIPASMIYMALSKAIGWGYKWVGAVGTQHICTYQHPWYRCPWAVLWDEVGCWWGTWVGVGGVV